MNFECFSANSWVLTSYAERCSLLGWKLCCFSTKTNLLPFKRYGFASWKVIFRCVKDDLLQSKTLSFARWKIINHHPKSQERGCDRWFLFAFFYKTIVSFSSLFIPTNMKMDFSVRYFHNFQSLCKFFRWAFLCVAWCSSWKESSCFFIAFSFRLWVVSVFFWGQMLILSLCAESRIVLFLSFFWGQTPINETVLMQSKIFLLSLCLKRCSFLS